MSSEILPLPQVSVLQEDPQEMRIQGLITTFAGLTWSIVVILFIGCYRAVRNTTTEYSKRKQTVLLIYMAYMALSSTLAFSQTIYGFWTMDRLHIFGQVSFPAVFLSFCFWGADGFMLWRCLVLYNNLKRGPRLFLWCFLFFLALCSFASGMTFILAIVLLGKSWFLVPTYMFMNIPIILSLFTNTALTSLIVLRVMYYKKTVELNLGKSSTTIYSRVIALCVESCALILFVEIPLAVALILKMAVPLYVTFTFLPHITVISALLPMFRIARRWDVATTFKVSQLNDIPMMEDTPQFAHHSITN